MSRSISRAGVSSSNLETPRIDRCEALVELIIRNNGNDGCQAVVKEAPLITSPFLDIPCNLRNFNACSTLVVKEMFIPSGFLCQRVFGSSV